MASQFQLPFSRVRRSLSTLDLYLILVALAGLAAFLPMLPRVRGELGSADLTFWVLAACVLPAEIIRFTINSRYGGNQVTLSRPFALAMLTGWGAPSTVVVFIVASVISDLIDRKPTLRILFNAGQYTLSIVAAGAAYTALGGRPSLGLAQVPAFIAAAAVLIFLNHLLVRIAVTLYEQRPLIVAILVGVDRVQLLEGAVQIGVVLVALWVAGHQLVLAAVLALPALPLVAAGRATARVEILSRARSSRAQESTEEAVQAMLHATELERTKLAADLHDGPLQRIDQFESRIEQVQASIEAGMPDVRLVDQLRLEIPALGRELRAMVAELRPPVLQRLGLAGALTHLAREFQTTYEIVVNVQVRADEQLSEELEVLLYRVTQEALTNVVKHARASQVDVAIAANNGVARLHIHDDGIGFEPRLIEDGHYGLAICRERVELAGGGFHADSRVGGGTTIQVEIGVTSLS